MAETLNIVLNGKIVKGRPGETILELAQRHGIEIPTLCHDPRLEPFSSCYLCVVEIEGVKNLQPSCSTKIEEGMAITTWNERIRKARKTALDLLVSNHYADCMAPCKETCPAGVDVQGYISLIEKGLYSEAVALIKEVNPLPAICGRVCVRPCEAACRRNLMGEGTGVGIDYLKRFASDIDLESPKRFIPKVSPPTGKKVAIIGGGPGGLSCAYFLQQKGHQCDIFEAAPHPGGWLRYGIPEYRLPNDIIDKEIKAITDIGVRIFCNKKLGDNLHYADLKKEYDAVILTIGSQKGSPLGCEGEDAMNVFSGIDFLRNMALTGQRYDFRGKTVAVVGGGNTAMDCCRTAVRCGADKVYVIYRRTEKEMPANPIEVHESKLEGVEYMFLTNPKRVNKDEEGKVKSLTCIRMELGEPDASGRRRPVPVENSDFDIEVDYVLAAIGQRTDVNFLDDINSASENGQLKVNRWGDIECNRETLQTGIPSVFAAGDAVTGPATLIEAIAQAKIAARSCHQFLSGEPLVPEQKEFLSKKTNFKEQTADYYLERYRQQFRHEMPTLPPEMRMNFNEVELGYENEEVARQEASRCLECGCVEYFTCLLKKYCTEYQADQKRFGGDFTEYEIDFRHPYIEIDNNKCILCGRCIRICKEVVGASALGFVNRGFKTFVAPSLGLPLQQTTCETCGLCIETCPTAAITENVPFKPGPVKLDTIDIIDPFTSEGFEVTLHHKAGYFMKATGRKGEINTDGNISRQAKFGYRYLNDPGRLLQPLIRENDTYIPVSFDQAFHLIIEKIKNVSPDENAFFAGARLTNEEIYAIQKLARAGVKTNNINSFHYLGRGRGYARNAMISLPFSQIRNASRIFILGSTLHRDHPLVNHMIYQTRHLHHIPVEIITHSTDQVPEHKTDRVLRVKSYYHFFKAVNYYLLESEQEDKAFIKNFTTGFDEYRDQLLAQDFDELFEKSGVCCMESLAEFSRLFNNEPHPVLIFQEKEVSSNTNLELINMMLITGKPGKKNGGLLALKEKNNSQGLIEMGACHLMAPGYRPTDDPEVIQYLQQVWNTENIPAEILSPYKLLKEQKLRNLFIFGEDPVGCALDADEIRKMIRNAEFVVVQDYFMTETARLAHLVLPASFPFETGGSYFNTLKQLQKFDKQLDCPLPYNSFEQIAKLLHAFGIDSMATPSDALAEYQRLFPADENAGNILHSFVPTTSDNFNLMFRYGVDIVNKRFEEEFAQMMGG